MKKTWEITTKLKMGILGGVTNVGVVGDLFPILENPWRCRRMSTKIPNGDHARRRNGGERMNDRRIKWRGIDLQRWISPIHRDYERR